MQDLTCLEMTRKGDRENLRAVRGKTRRWENVESVSSRWFWGGGGQEQLWRAGRQQAARGPYLTQPASGWAERPHWACLPTGELGLGGR